MKTLVLFVVCLLSACTTKLVKSDIATPDLGLIVLPLEYKGQRNEMPRVEVPVTMADTVSIIPPDMVVGAARFDQYLPLIISNKRVGLLVNPTSMVGQAHLVDTLRSLGVNVVKVFAPEHGFRGTADAGEHVKSGFDPATGLPIVSLYGSHRKPTAEDLADIDVLIYDIQDVGVRFYTYISTMTLAMEACAAYQKKIVILDRPNPNGHYVDGPVLKPAFKSFVGMHSVPVVYGMTSGEYAQMVRGEDWIVNSANCDLSVVPCANYTHQMPYTLPIKPSPNLRNNRAIYCYPSLCFFEGTPISVGRGTDAPFEMFGAPNFTHGTYQFTPESREGAKTPPHQGQLCRGYVIDERLTEANQFTKVDLSHLILAYQLYPETDKSSFFNADHFFDKLAGSDELRQQIIAGVSEADIRASWQPDLQKFMTIRAKYLLYE